MEKLRLLLELFRARPRVAACEVFVHEDASVSIDACIIVRKGTSLELERKAMHLKLEEIKHFAGNTPVILSLAGGLMIHKRIEKTKDEDWRVVIPRAFPKFRSQDFFIQYTPLDEVSGFLSLVRKQVVESLISQFSGQGLVLFDFILGPFALQTLAWQISDAQPVIRTSRYELEIADKKIRELKPGSGAGDHVISLGKGSVDGDIAIQYASSIPFFTNVNTGIEYADVSPVAGRRKAYEETSRLRLIAIWGATMLILFFMGSVVAFAVTTRRLFAIEQTFGAEVKKVRPADDVMTEFSAVRSAVDELGATSRSHLSFYADRLAVTRPVGISFTALKMFPIVSGARQGQLTRFNGTVISVSGSCHSHEQLVRWLRVLTREEWVASIQNQLYHGKEGNAPAAFSFDIHIQRR